MSNQIIIDKSVLESSLIAFETDDWQKKMQAAILIRSVLDQSNSKESPIWYHKDWGFEDHIFYRPTEVIPDGAVPLYAKPQHKKFDGWATKDGDTWYEHPADAQIIYDIFGDEPIVGAEYELVAGWSAVTARYRIVSVDGDGVCEVECVSHPEENVN